MTSSPRGGFRWRARGTSGRRRAHLEPRPLDVVGVSGRTLTARGRDVPLPNSPSGAPVCLNRHQLAEKITHGERLQPSGPVRATLRRDAPHHDAPFVLNPLRIT